MRKHLVAVTWECCGYIEVEAATLYDAMGKIAKNPDDYSLPHEAFYVDGSFRLSTDYIDEMRAICTSKEMRKNESNSNTANNT